MIDPDPGTNTVLIEVFVGVAVGKFYFIMVRCQQLYIEELLEIIGVNFCQRNGFGAKKIEHGKADRISGHCFRLIILCDDIAAACQPGFFIRFFPAIHFAV